jgi:hypothetical protein
VAWCHEPHFGRFDGLKTSPTVHHGLQLQLRDHHDDQQKLAPLPLREPVQYEYEYRDHYMNRKWY